MVALIQSHSERAWTHRHFTLDEYYRMGELGFFENQRVELVRGEIIEMPPIGPLHNTGVNLADEAVRKVYKRGFVVRVQSSFTAPDDTEIYPDVMVLSGRARDYRTQNPWTAVLIIEVAETSLGYDRAIKTGLYSAANVPEYWVLNLVERRLEVNRDPVVMDGQPFNAGYRSTRLFFAGDEVAPLSRPEARIKVADLLP